MEEQGVFLQPMGTMQRRSSYAVTEEPTVQQWLRCEGGTTNGEPLQKQPQTGAAACGEQPAVEQEHWGTYHPWGPVWGSA